MHITIIGIIIILVKVSIFEIFNFINIFRLSLTYKPLKNLYISSSFFKGIVLIFLVHPEKQI